MRIRIACPAPARSRSGNRFTALRWARILDRLGHRVSIDPPERVGPGDLLVALHARRSAKAVDDFRRRFPGRPVFVALTGTDLYRDLERSRTARRTVRAAHRLLVLHDRAAIRLPGRLRGRVRVVHQSVRPTPGKPKPVAGEFRVAVAGHLRPLKDPLRAALAVRRLPAESRIRVLHAGRALTGRMETRARRESVRNPRYRWLGELPRWRTRRLIAGSRLLVLSSRMEGGAHVISEAAVDSVPVLSSNIHGSTGLLGVDYPGLFRVGDTRALRNLLLRAENDRLFLADLRRRCRSLAPRFRPAREAAAWRALLAEIG